MGFENLIYHVQNTFKMRKSIFIFMLLLSHPFFSNAQTFKKIRVGFGGGLSIPDQKEIKKGGIAYLEPSYRIKDRIAIGVRLEANIANQRDVTNSMFIDYSGVNSCSINGQYYLLQDAINRRTFIGFGFGIFSTPATSGEGSINGIFISETFSSENKLGIFPRFGYDMGHFTFMIEYNLGPSAMKKIVIVENGNATTTSTKIRLSYLSIKAGLTIGGGKK
jgi:hypothetical protein